jgi:putative flippase GtrA
MNEKKRNYILIGGLNTLFGYIIGVGLYKLLVNLIGIFWVGAAVNMASITFSFITYKVFVFKTHGNWLAEYLKAILVYGVMALISTFLLFFFIERLGLSIWIAQAITMLIAMAVSYVSHSRFTFRSKTLS